MHREHRFYFFFQNFFDSRFHFLFLQKKQAVFGNAKVNILPVYIFEERLNVGLSRRGVVNKIRVLVNIHNKKRYHIPRRALVM